MRRCVSNTGKDGGAGSLGGAEKTLLACLPWKWKLILPSLFLFLSFVCAVWGLLRQSLASEVVQTGLELEISPPPPPSAEIHSVATTPALLDCWNYVPAPPPPPGGVIYLFPCLCARVCSETRCQCPRSSSRALRLILR